MERAIKPIVVLSGPTASGKSKLAVEVALAAGAEIINADSVQVYRGFDIGAGKPEPSEFQAVPHHLFSYVAPESDFNAEVFRRDALDVIADVQNRCRRAIVAGGTGLYIRSLLSGLVRIDSGDAEEREFKEIIDERERVLYREGRSDEEVKRALHSWLSSLDPLSAGRISASDSARIRRALLVKLATGQSLAELHDRHQNRDVQFSALVIVLLPQRERLYRAINERVEQMIAAGLVDEVAALRSQHAASCRPFSSIGYRQVCRHLDGEIDHFRMVDLIKQDTRRFAKRQYTWWRNQPLNLGWRPAAELLPPEFRVGISLAPASPFFRQQLPASLAGVIERYCLRAGSPRVDYLLLED